MRRCSPSPRRNDKLKRAPWRKSKGKGKQRAKKSSWEDDEDVVEVEVEQCEAPSGSGRSRDRLPEPSRVRRSAAEWRGAWSLMQGSIKSCGGEESWS